MKDKIKQNFNQKKKGNKIMFNFSYEIKKEYDYIKAIYKDSFFRDEFYNMGSSDFISS